MAALRHSLLIPGPAGPLETLVESPPGPVRGVALVAHPHPLFGGTMTNKVTQTLASAYLQLGCVAVRMNFRGVGHSGGSFAEGVGETQDWLAVHAQLSRSYPDLPLFLAGFSFGAYVQSEVARHLNPQRLVLVGPAVGTFPLGTVRPDTLILHGERDQTIPLAHVLRWAEPQDLGLVVIPDADHFFHRRLHHIKRWVTELCHVPADH